MSLPYRGIFDLNQNWQGPQFSHSKGTAVDVRGNGGLYSVPSAQQSAGFSPVPLWPLSGEPSKHLLGRQVLPGNG